MQTCVVSFKGPFITQVNKIRRFQVFLWPLSADQQHASAHNSCVQHSHMEFPLSQHTAEIIGLLIQCGGHLWYLIHTFPAEAGCWIAKERITHCLPVLSQHPLKTGCPWPGSIFTRALPSQAAPKPPFCFKYSQACQILMSELGCSKYIYWKCNVNTYVNVNI